MTERRIVDLGTENVVPITALEQTTIDALWDEVRKALHPEPEPEVVPE